MKTDKRIRVWLVVGMALIGAMALLVYVTTPREKPMTRVVPPQPRVIAAGLTAWPMHGLRDADATQAVPPVRPTQDALYAPGARYPLARLCNLVYLSNVSTGSGTYDWDSIDQCFTDAAQFTVTLASGVTISQPVILNLPPQFIASGGAGSSGDPWSALYMPAWITATRTFETYPTAAPGVPVTQTYNAVAYDAVFREQMTTLIADAGTRYNGNAQLLAVRVNPGFEEENQPNKPQASEAAAYFLGRAETVSSCAEYLAFVWALGDAAVTAFPDHPVVLPASVGPCASGVAYSDSFIRDFWTRTPTPQPAGIAMHSLAGDRPDASEPITATNWAWKQLTAGDDLAARGYPVLFEFAESPNVGFTGSNFADDPWQAGYWGLLAGMGASGDFLVRNYLWNDLRTALDWEIADRMVKNGLWVVFRDLEYPAFMYDASYGGSGYRDDFARNGVLLTPTSYPQACSQAIGPAPENWRATVIARATSYYAGTTPVAPVPCAYVTPLPTPKATLQVTPGSDEAADTNMLQRLFNRQARIIPPAAVMDIAAETAWTYYGDTRVVSMTVAYLDIGTHALRLHLPSGAGTGVTQDVTLGDTGLWKRYTWTYTSGGYISNTLASNTAFIRLENRSATQPIYVHEVYADVGAETGIDTPTPTETLTPSATPTPSVTPTASNTPSVSPTPSHTPTPAATPTGTLTASPTRTASPTFTPSATPTAVGTVLACPTWQVAVDGDVAGYAAIATPVNLSRSSAVQDRPASPTPTTTVTLTPSRTPRATSTGTVTAVPTSTHTPTATPTQDPNTLTLWCAHSSSVLYLAGQITDTHVLSSTRAFSDTMILTLDGLADSFNRLRDDDHDIYLGANGRVRDYQIYPISATVATSRTATGWNFEIGIDLDTLAINDLASGRQIGAGFGLWDFDQAGSVTWDILLSWAQFALRME